MWQPDPELGDPVELALAEVTAALPSDRSRCQTCSRSAAVLASSRPGSRSAPPHVALLATDQSPRFVELTRERGVPAQLMDVQHLLPADDSYDVVVAMWMLYHVPDLDRGLAEIRRVLRPGALWSRSPTATSTSPTCGARPAAARLTSPQFSSENGEAALRRHFDDVRRQDLRTRAVFPDHAAAQAYLVLRRGPGCCRPTTRRSWPREYAGHVTVFTAR